MNARTETKLIIALIALIALNVYMDRANADVYKCGNTYTDQPCGVKVHIVDNSVAEMDKVAGDYLNRQSALATEQRAAQLAAQEIIAANNLRAAQIKALNSSPDLAESATMLGGKFNPINVNVRGW